MKLVVVLILFCFFRYVLINEAISTTKHYIVYMGDHSHLDSQSVISSSHEMLASVTGSIRQAEEAVVHHYSKSFRGFSAILTPEQAQQLSERESVISVFESRTHRVQTTHSWEFLQIDAIPQYSHVTNESEYESDVIVGVIDTGIWPESESFSDKGLGPVPKRFKGECVVGDQFTVKNCNRKIIGARFYSRGFEAEYGPLESLNRTFFRSPRDENGHGTHTASTVAGSVVNNVSIFGIARGTARGGMPSARLAIYKACWLTDCSEADLLSAFDDATNDGVDILSVSVGLAQSSFFTDAISIGSFHAFRKGVLISASAGNARFPGTAINLAPWILTVAASSIDREFNSNVYLGNSKILKGTSINPLKMNKYYGIIAATAAAAAGVSAENASFCKNNTLDHNLIKGKIVVCTLNDSTESRGDKSVAVRQGGGVGMILIDPIGKDVGVQFVIPATLIGQNEAEVLQEYLTTAKIPTAKIYPTITVLNTSPAPRMAVFSSMGPSVITPEIIKPDITAPGLNILAAWSPLGIDGSAGRPVDYNIVSGTSMSCPHVSAIAAIIKSRHPSWSPSAIKSAIMTTATVMDNTGRPILKDPDGSPTTPFDYGSGHINPVAALDPGLIYDFGSNDIINFLCSNSDSPAEIRNVTGEPVTCKNPPIPSYDLNYPSIGVASMNGSVSVLRTVTYYGKGPTAFNASVENPSGVKVAVTPYNLKFKESGEKMSFKVDFMPYKSSNGSFVFGSITWSNGIYKVRSPIGLNVVSV
ncbi:Peptidase S8/S53 domain [Macleaya cordata]|uniref:Peptidase S8/S53 domain n=1 Tax=Macleaya cordata TaxID=56857 RepID=A0A200PZE6_MACCD|nr:Peptidase S8/S53 domain [Macleaya cordata]